MAPLAMAAVVEIFWQLRIQRHGVRRGNIYVVQQVGEATITTQCFQDPTVLVNAHDHIIRHHPGVLLHLGMT